jgi:hypothetical protein
MTAHSYRPAANLQDAPYAIEFYYKVRWGTLPEFLELFRKNHYPVLLKQLETGRVLEIRADEPQLHFPEQDRWDYRVTLVYKNLLAAYDSGHEAALLREMYPDWETFEREEKRRFELMIAHWDLPLKTTRIDRAGA